MKLTFYSNTLDVGRHILPSSAGPRKGKHVPSHPPTPICDAISDGVLVVDDTGTITFANSVAADTLRRDVEHIIGQPIHDLLHCDSFDHSSMESVECPDCVLLHDGTVHRGVHGTFRRGDSDMFPATYNVVPMWKRETREGAVIAFRDISAREKGIRERRRLQALIEETPAFVSMADRDGRVTYLNKTGRSWLGMGDNEPIEDLRLTGETMRVALEAARLGVWQGERRQFLKDRLPRPREISVLQTIVAHKNPLDEVEFFSTIAVDITRQKRLEADRARLLAIIEETPDFVATADASGRILYYNRAARRMLGIGDEEDISAICISETHPEWAARLVLDEGLPKAARDRIWQGETAFLSRDGREIPVWQVIVAHKNRDGEVDYFSTIARDITERKRMEERLQFLANHDPLTGVMNRARFQQELELHLEGAQREGASGAVLYLDLDEFKDINDSFGHQVGDDILQRVVHLFRSHLRPSDVLARLGGDEFAILLPGVTADEAKQVGERLLALLEDELVYISDRTVRLQASVGVATYPDHADNVKDLLINADLSMYAAKKSGGGRVLVCTNGSGRELALSRLKWEDKCRAALQDDGFVLHYQPIVHLATKRIIAYELLLRMKGNDGELIMPGAFLPTCERSDLIRALDRWVLQRAFQLLAEGSIPDGVSIHINLSRKTLADNELVSFIRDQVEGTRIDATRVVFELTETAAIKDISRVACLMTELQQMGFRFALDDFGVGFSTFGALQRLPVHFLKIDGSFIQDLRKDSVNQHLVRAIIEVARGLGKQTVAEFVSDEETLKMLTEAGVDYGQGSYIGRPEPTPA